jgi:flagellar motility protein MotE (MotC chaperone)
MKRSHCAVFVLAAALSLVASFLPVCGAERQPAWGWKAEEGAGPPPKHPRPAPAANSDAWRAKVAEPDHKAPKPEPQVKAAPGGEASATAKSYCENIADPALDARFLSQKAELTRLEEELAKRTSLLEAKRVELQGWLKRRDDFMSKAEGSLIALYSKIKPDAAAPLLAAMDEEAAAALLLKLSAKTSSAILDEMETGKAARLVSVMIGAAKPEDKASAQKASSDQAKDVQKEAGQAETAGKRS